MSMNCITYLMGVLFSLKQQESGVPPLPYSGCGWNAGFLESYC